MSRIPDCRNDEHYNQKYLNDTNAQFVTGFDWCVEQAMDTFFDNLCCSFGKDDFIVHVLNGKLPDDMEYGYEVESSFGNPPETREIKTYWDLLRWKLLEWVEGERDQLITSMVDGMDEDEYAAIKARVDGGGAE